MGRRIFGSTGIAALVTLVLAMLLGGPGIGAQGTPATVDDEDVGPPRPAHIHAGTCEDLGDVVYPLNDLAPVTPFATPEAVLASPEAEVREAVPESETIVDASLEELLAEPHAINVHQSAENIGTYIACGNITGSADEGQVVVQLEELNDSGYAGFASLIPNDDGTTTVRVELVPADDDLVATPAA